MFSPFGTVLVCDRRRDRRTPDERIYRTSIAARGKNNAVNALAYFVPRVDGTIQTRVFCLHFVIAFLFVLYT